MSITILIADDEERWCRIVGDFLRNEGYRVLEAADGQQVMELMRSEEKIDLVVLDIMMPVLDGLETCRLIRKRSAVPVMIVTARDAEADELVGFHCGADDFIAKPFDRNVLAAKIQAILRRTYDFAANTELIANKGAVLNTADATLTYEGQRIDLTKNDYKILKMLLENKGKTVSRDALMTRLWETDCFVDENTLTVNITRLRKKLEQAGLTDFIVTRKGMGYLISDED